MDYGMILVMENQDKITELLSRGVVEVIDEEHLRTRLLSGEKLRIKLGIDPTSPNIHIGRAVQLLKLRSFQDAGHTAVFIVGDSTGTIGDTSDKDSERPMLSREQVKANMQTYLDQAFKILDKDKTETHYNSEWLEKLGYLEIGNMASLFSVHGFITREVIAKRIKAGQRVSAVEAFYPIMQGYDSVAVRADVELGGTDQRYNLLAGRKIQPLYKQEPQDIMMLELLEGIDGRKMSSSWGNVITITEEPKEMFGKVMTIRDELMKKYFELCTKISLKEIAEILKNHPKEAKIRLAFEITKLYQGEIEAKNAQASFEETFSKGGIPNDAQEVPNGKPLEVLVQSGAAASTSAARRLFEAGAVTDMADDRKLNAKDEFEAGHTYRVGKHKFIKIKN